MITALITRQFWILSVRVVIRHTLGSCTICVRAVSHTSLPIMSDLPVALIQACDPFSKVWIDYADPLPKRECRLQKAREYKVYIAVFVCIAVKPVHLELVLELSTDAFLVAFDRFVAQRGLQFEIYFDCGTNYVDASKQLRILVIHLNNRDQLTAHAFCSWNFNPPAVPHVGGLGSCSTVNQDSVVLSDGMSPSYPRGIVHRVMPNRNHSHLAFTHDNVIFIDGL